MQEQADRLRSEVWRHLEDGEWRSAMLLAEDLSRIDALGRDSVELAKSAGALAMISDAIRLNEPVDQDVSVRLEKIARAWPRLAEARSFQSLVQAAMKVAARNRTTPISAPAPAEPTSSAQITPSGQKPKPSLLHRIARPRGWAGITATVACVLAALLVLNMLAYCYLEGQPVSARGPESEFGIGPRSTLQRWYGLIDLKEPVDTIILGDSEAGVNLVTGPVAGRLGGSVLNVSTNVFSSLLIDAWMLDYYVQRFGPPRNVILLRCCHGYEYGRNLEFMSVVPLEWGWWDRLGTVPDWKAGELRELFLSKYAVLDSDSDILTYRLIHPLDLFAQPSTKTTPSSYYSMGTIAPSAMGDYNREKEPWQYDPFSPSSDSMNALTNMSGLARSLGFQLYIAIGPEWDEAYKDPDRQAKVSGMEEWLTQFTDSQYVHMVLSTPMTFRADQMQNADHLRPGAEREYTEAVLGEIVTIQDNMSAVQAKPVGLASVVMGKREYAIGEEPTVTLSLTTGTSVDTNASVEGDVSCLIRPSGKSDLEWVDRAPATAFVVHYGENTEVSLTLSVAKLDKAGAYDLIVFLRQNAGTLSFETRIELLNMIEVK